MHRLLAPVTTTILIVTIVAGCGGGSGKTRAHAGHESKQLALAQCMRAHGVTNFPDPTAGPGGEGFSITATPGSQTLTIDGSTFGGPAFTTAGKNCKLLGGGPGPPPISVKQKQQLVDFARCMRAHGVSDWADPTFPPSGGVAGGGPTNPSDRNSPTVQRAAKTCNRIVGL